MFQNSKENPQKEMKRKWPTTAIRLKNSKDLLLLESKERKKKGKDSKKD